MSAKKGNQYAAGVWPACTSKEDGKAYWLLGLQHSVKSPKKWCCFWGWQDADDASIKHTAAREGSEEGLGCFGSQDEILQALSHPEQHHLIFKNCFMIYLGVLDAKQRDYVVKLFSSKRWDPHENSGLKAMEKEVDRVAWFEGSTMLKACQVPQKPGENLVFPEMAQGHHIRTFLQSWIQDKDTWTANKLEEFCLTGKSPIQPYYKW